MFDRKYGNSAFGGRLRYSLPILAVLGILLFVLTYLGIQKSRSDSLELLRKQGIALTASLTQSADNAIKANSFFDLLVQEKFSDLAGFLTSREQLDFSYEELADFASAYGVDGIFVFDAELVLQTYGVRGVFIDPDEILGKIFTDLEAFQRDSANFRSQKTVFGDLPGEVSIYYFEKTIDRDYIVVIVSDALFYAEAKKAIGIGYLVQNIGREVGIEYIFFQIPEGIVFSSRKIGPVLKIERDSFLVQALSTDTIVSREHILNDRKVLELVKAFSSDEYGTGVFRLGISLEKYYEIVTAYDRQMIALSVVIFAVLVLFVRYVQGKQKRLFLDRSIKRIQSLSEKVFDSMNSGLVVVGKDGMVELANPEFCRTFSIDKDNLTGQPWSGFTFQDVIPIERILSGKESTGELEAVYSGPAGNKYLLINMARLYDHRQQVTGAVAVIYDYTRIRELEETARRKERLTELGDLAAGVAHEIRNPLNAISIAAQRLLAEFEPRENVEEFHSFAAQIKSEASRLNEIVTRFLALARGRQGEGTRINLGSIVEDAVSLLRLGLQRDDITISTDIDPNIGLRASQDRVKQLTINLVKNAIEACDKTGGIISVVLKEVGSEIRLSVFDTG
ncbi:MAG: PAS domain-containing protein, partial [Candidatus Zixiibacteriota bacterium]